MADEFEYSPAAPNHTSETGRPKAVRAQTDSAGRIRVTADPAGSGAADAGDPFKREDDPHTSGDRGVFILALRNDGPSVLAGADLDYSGISTDSRGNVFVSGPAAHDGAVSARPVLVGGRADSGVPTAVSAIGDAVWKWLDLNGRSLVGLSPPNSTTVAPANSTSTAEEASRIIKASAGVLYGLTVYNNNAATRYIQLYNSATLPADAVVPVLTFEVAAQTSRSIDFGGYGRGFTTGIVVANSSTDTTKTIGAADSLFDAQYV